MAFSLNTLINKNYRHMYMCLVSTQTFKKKQRCFNENAENIKYYFYPFLLEFVIIKQISLILIQKLET